MKSIDLDNPVVSKLQDAGDLVFAGLMWFVFSIPVITTGPASAALYYTVAKVVRHKRGTVKEEFLHSFKDNLRHGIVYTLIYGALIALAGLFFYNLKNGKGTGNSGFIAGGVILIFFLLFTLPYVFPVLSRFDDRIGNQFHIIILMAVGHIPTTLLLAVLFGASAAAVYFIPYLVLVVPALYTFLSTFLIERVFRKHMKKPSDGEDVPWYLE